MRTPNPGSTYPSTTIFTYNPKTGTVIALAPQDITSRIYSHPPGYHLDPASGYWVNAQGAVDPNDPQVVNGLAKSAADNPNSDGTPGGASGGGQGGDGGAPTDWSSMLGIYGLPPDVQAKVNKIFSDTSDVNQATLLALAYIRGTDWYAQTYPGIQEGIARGVVSNESDYRAYVNQLQGLNKQFYGTDITSQQVADFLKSGYSVGHVNQLFQGHAYAAANRNDINYLAGAFGDGPLSDQQLETLGQQNAGLDSAAGMKLQSLVDKANQRMKSVFSGTLATSSLSLGPNGLQSPSLAGRKGTPDVQA